MDLQQRLSDGFTTTIINLSTDSEGKNIATLITANHNTGSEEAVLYVHGFIDYFFHPHVSDEFLAQGIDFYALDLRKYGRSLLPHQTPNYCESLEEYFPEITEAIATMQQNGVENIYVLAHSTGCPIVSLYANKGQLKDAIRTIIFNSPFLELPILPIAKYSLYAIGKIITAFKPKAKAPAGLNHVYTQTVHKSFAGEWDYNLNFKPIVGFPVYFKWAIGVTDAQHWLRKHSAISVPILVMHSYRYSKKTTVCEETRTSDTILNVEHIKKYAPLLGENVTMLSVDDALHDIFLSKKAVREQAFNAMFQWLNQYRN